ncbi:MAG TPA: sigma-70 family RNA polymerase sigma factor [Pyrinomonadaceae bacterium]|jgi:RNA polymerase sigma factor (TIGR02999 family)|nr:sigma-70 family RNA polymerase sigma factor [Pyrinomonadaceae bacterium]
MEIVSCNTSPTEITGLLLDWSNGDEIALEKLLPLVERELHRLAHYQIRRLRPGNTLQTTALINETYLRLINQNRVEWQNRAHFFAISAQLMRRILLNYIRDQKRMKRGGNAVQVSLSEATIMSPQKTDELLALDEALEKLAAFDERKSKVVELRFFGGLSVEETAEVLKISQITVMRDWNMAKAWLAREIRNDTE